jgi:uncharacterized protein
VTSASVINIPVEALSDEALLGVIDDYINREGTDYGLRDTDLAQKRAAVRNALASGRAVITYDPNSRTTTVIARESLPRS